MMPSHAPPLRVGGKDPKVLAAAAVTQLAGGGGSGVDGSTQLSVREVKEKREGEREGRAASARVDANVFPRDDERASVLLTR